MRRHKFYGEWSQAFREHLERMGREGRTQQEFAEKTRLSVQMVNSYFTGRSKPGLQRLPEMADALNLNPKERERFIWLAYEHYTPEPVWTRVRELEARYDETALELGKTRAELAETRTKLAGLEVELTGLRARFLRVAEHLSGADREVIERG